MNQPARNIIAIAVVALAMCVDRPASDWTTQHPMPRATLAGQFVRTLQASICRIVPRLELFESRAFPAFAITWSAAPIVWRDVAPVVLSPFQFRLPPPAIR